MSTVTLNYPIPSHGNVTYPKLRVILDTLQISLGTFTSVKDFGAIGDGVTDDTAAILAAIASIAGGGGSVYFPGGTYLIGAGDGINIVYSNIALVLAPGAILKKSGTGAAITIGRQANLTVNNIVICGGKIISADTSTANTGISICPDATNTGNHIWIYQMWLDAMGQYGITQAGANGTVTDLHFSDVTITNNGAVSGNHVRQSFILNASTSCKDLFIDNVYSEQINDGTGSTDGCKLQGWVGASINGLTIKGGNVTTLVFNNMTNVVASNLRVVGTGGNGLQLDTSTTGINTLTNVICTGTFASTNAVVFASAGGKYLHISNLWTSGQLIYASTPTFDNVIIENSYINAGIRLENATVTNSTFRNVQSSSLTFISGNNNTFQGCVSLSSSGTGLRVTGNSNNFINNIILSPTSYGIHVAGNTNVVVDNYITGSGSGAVNVASGTGNIIGPNYGDLTITDSGASTTFQNFYTGLTASKAAVIGSSKQLTTSTTTLTELAGLHGLSVSKALITDGSGILSTSTTTSTELAGLHGLSASVAVITDGSGILSTSSTTSTELGYVHGVTSAIQTQLGTKALDSAVVHNTGTESISGAKTFNNTTVFGSGFNISPLTSTSIQSIFNYGSATTPSIALSDSVSANNTGFYRSADSVIGITCGGAASGTLGASASHFFGDVYVGNDGTAGVLRIYSNTTNRGTLNIGATANSGAFNISITNAAVSASRNYTIPEPGADANFVMSEGSATINGTKTFGNDTIFSGDIYTVVWTDYSSTSTVVGWTSFTSKKIFYKKIGKIVFVQFELTGTSNATNATFTLPYSMANSVDLYGFIFAADNGGAGVAGASYITVNTSTVNLYKDVSTANPWTNTGTKACRGQFWYQTT